MCVLSPRKKRRLEFVDQVELTEITMFAQKTTSSGLGTSDRNKCIDLLLNVHHLYRVTLCKILIEK